MRTKLCYFRYAILTAAVNYDIIILTETWLNDNFLDVELGLTNYNVYRQDRISPSKERGGGVLVAVRDTIPSSRIMCESADFDQLFVKLTDSNICLGSAYFPPRSNSDQFAKHCNDVNSIEAQLLPNNFILVGDYNLPEVNWLSEEVNSPSDRGQTLINHFSFLNLKQHNRTPNCYGGVLDLIFSRDDFLLSSSCLEPLLPLDNFHPALQLTIPSNSLQVSTLPPDEYFNFRKADYSGLNLFFGTIDWPTLLSNVDINQNVSVFYDILYEAINRYVPKSVHVRSDFPGWFSSDLIKAIRDKKRLHKTYKCNRTSDSYAKFSEVRSLCKRMYVNCENEYLSYIEAHLPDDPKLFWRHIGSATKSNQLPKCMHNDSVSSDDSKIICDLFVDQFRKNYSDNNANIRQMSNFAINQVNIVDSMQIGLVEIFDGLSNLSCDKGAGPDKIPNLFWNACKYSMARPIYLLFNKSLSSGTFPDVWKVSKIHPIYKKGDKSCVSNYRPVSILSALPKFFEKYVANNLSVIYRNMISPEQHGFISYRSTITNLLEIENKLMRSLDNGLQTDVIYTDLTKAFDRVPHKLLLDKLEAYGISGSLLQWISSYLVGRVQYVSVNNCESAGVHVPSGVPQGSHVGPLFFNFYINDLPKIFRSSSVLLYADDTKIYKQINSIEDAVALQEDLNSSFHWCSDNGLEVNIKKCVSMSYTKKKNKLVYNYSLGGELLDEVEYFKDLGVVFDSKLSFNRHIGDISTVAWRTWGLVYRNFRQFRSQKILFLLYKTMIRPLLEYCSVAWSPKTNHGVKTLETIQHKILRQIMYATGDPMSIDNHDYDPILRSANLLTLKQRRDFNDVMFLHKLITGSIDSPVLLSHVNFRVPRLNSRNNDIFVADRFRTNVGDHCALNRAMSLVNEIENEIDFLSMDNFGLQSSLKRLL